MAAAFDPTLPDDRNWVRSLTGDTGPSFALEDETIDAYIAEVITNTGAGGQHVKYLAASIAGETILGLSKDVVRKKVDNLEIETAGGDANSAYRNLIARWQARGAELLMPKPRAFRVL